LQDAFGGIDTTLLAVALAVVFIILLIVYRSPFLPIIVLFSSMAALCIAVWVVVELARADIVQINGQVQGILFILVIGAATDYSLLYIARYREELVEHKQAWNATWAALKSSYEPIIAAGGTVTAGLLCLLLSDLGSNQALGPVGGMGIALSILASLVLLPSLLALFGRRVFWPRIPHYLAGKNEDHYVSNHPVWSKIGRFVRKYPRRIWVASTVLLLVACVGVFQLKAEGVSQSQLVLGESEAVAGQKILDDHFPAGSGAPTLIISRQDKQDEVVQLLEDDEGVSSVAATVTGIDSGVMPLGAEADKIYDKVKDTIAEKRAESLATIKKEVKEQTASLPEFIRESAYKSAYEAATANVPSLDEMVAKADPFKDAEVKVSNNQILLQATLADPADSFIARETVSRLRDGIKSIDQDAKVGGTSAIQLDTNISSLRDVQVVIPAILVAITIILMLLLRAIVAPLLLLLTTVLSFGATMGISALLFNHLWGYPGADPAVVIFGFVFLVAFGIDYNIFLMTRVREETMKLGVSRGTIKGLVVTGGVITSAGIVLAATFTALSVIPILFLAQIAFIVAFGVLLDTIVVRSLLVPALTLEVGKPMWWPSKLWRNKSK
jgi:RND superfamily putative drug exporter